MSRKIGVLLSNILMFLETLSSLIYTPYMLRMLGQAEYGVYTLVLSATSYLTLLDLGMRNAVVKFASKYRMLNQNEEQRKLLGIVTLYYSIIAGIVVVLGVALYEIFPTVFAHGLSEPEMQKASVLLLITIANVAFSFLTASFRHYTVAYERFTLSKGIPIIQIMLRVSACYLVLKFGYGSIGIVSVNFIVTVGLNFIFVAYVLKNLHIKPTLHNVDKRSVRSVFVFSSVVLLQMVATQINSMAGSILITAFTANASVIVAVYGIGAQINTYVSSIAGGINGVLMPGVVRFVEKDNRPESIQNEMIRIGRILLIALGLIWVVFLVYGKQFIILWAGEENRQAYTVAMLLMTPNCLVLPQVIGSQFLWAKDKHKTQAYLKLATVLVNVILTIFLIINWDPLIGAAAGTAISIVIGDLFAMAFVFKKDIGIKLTSYYRDLFRNHWVCLIITTVVGYFFSLLNLSGWIGFTFNCLVICFIYSISMLFMGLNDSEKHRVKAYIKEIREKTKRKRI